jgi:hypothetical protein
MSQNLIFIANNQHFNALGSNKVVILHNKEHTKVNFKKQLHYINISPSSIIVINEAYSKEADYEFVEEIISKAKKSGEVYLFQHSNTTSLTNWTPFILKIDAELIDYYCEFNLILLNILNKDITINKMKDNCWTIESFKSKKARELNIIYSGQNDLATLKIQYSKNKFFDNDIDEKILKFLEGNDYLAVKEEIESLITNYIKTIQAL